ncbi:dTDP-4-dehydrorhamnose reductase [Hamadaea tsunoensis]|uniref:dTDP-4-dehydrorhamnose reductase n=1 Tax=Hamadaea tsunoensis TaxID=53368 RepID=UPI0003FE55F8|nr:dTDP-4-dehydrorhamnose reductase [Hamadaea tsunoensis]
MTAGTGKVLITGAGGMLGRALTAAAPAATALTRRELDLLDAAATADAVAGHDVVINAAAWTDVDRAETEEAEATRINGDAVANLAAACASANARLIHVSTDYVFAGDAATPYAEDAPTAPLNAYGRSKLAGELAVAKLLPAAGYVVRTAWLYDRTGRNFLTTMLRLAGERDFVDVVDDQRGQPTTAPALAAQLLRLAARPDAAPGIYHGTAGGETTWYAFTRAIFALTGLDPDRVRPTTSERFVRPAPRPAYSVLGHDRWRAAGLAPLADWQDLLHDLLGGGPAGPTAHSDGDEGDPA